LRNPAILAAVTRATSHHFSEDIVHADQEALLGFLLRASRALE
jgi:hypothetical protein